MHAASSAAIPHAYRVRIDPICDSSSACDVAGQWTIDDARPGVEAYIMASRPACVANPRGRSTMQADEAAGMLETEEERDQFRRRAAVAIACFAMLLAITSLGGNNAT